MTSPAKAELRVVCFDDLGFAPRFEYGEMAEVAGICGAEDGTELGTAGGMLTADMVCGVDNELIGYMQSLGEPNLLPIRPLLGIGVRARMAWELWKARKEV